jgi:glucokinase
VLWLWAVLTLVEFESILNSSSLPRLALEIFDFTGKVLGDAFCNFIAFSAPEAIILFGGLANAGDLLLNPIRKQMNENVVFLWKDKVKVLKSSLPGADAAVLGASALGWKD